MAQPPQPSGTPSEPDKAKAPGAEPPAIGPKPKRTSTRAAAAKQEAAKKAPTRRKAAAAQPTSTAVPPRPKSPKKPSAARAAKAPKAPAPPAAPSKPTQSKNGTHWGRIAATVMGVLAAGTALFTLRGSARKEKAHQADGADSSRSFEARIADEGTIPDE